MSFLIIFFLTMITAGTIYGREEVPGPDYKLLRQDEDWSFLKNKSEDRPLFKFKYIPLGENAYLSVGGELRERFEYYSNYIWGDPLNEGDGYYLHRIMGHADFHFLKRYRGFIQLKSNTVSEKKLPPRSIDKDELDLHQLFFDWNNYSFVFRGGRQEFNYGSSRLISVREGPNVRQSFDAIKIMYQWENFNVDCFASRPVETNPGIFDDESNYGQELHGIYAILYKQLDLYWLLYERDNVEFHSGVNDENRHSFGVRWFSKKSSHLDYDFEAVLQNGNFGGNRISAWTVASYTGYTWINLAWKPRLALKANVASGDGNLEDNSLNTFNALFPKGAYFNEAAIIGPANIMDLHPSVSVQPENTLTLILDWDFLWRHSLEDGLYNIPLDPTVAPGESEERYIGSQLAVTAEWEISENFFFLSQYMHFFTGSFLKETTPGKDIDFYTMWLTFKF